MKKLLSIVLLFVLLFSMAGEAFAFAPQDPGQTVTIGDFGYIDNEGFLWLWGPNGCEEAGVPIGDTSERWIDEPHKVMEDVVAFSRGTHSTIVLKKMAPSGNSVIFTTTVF